MHLDGVIPSIPDDIENGVSSLLIPLGASSDFLSLGLESGEESYNQFVSKIIQEVGVPDSEPYGPGKTNWLKQIASDLQDQWFELSQEDQTIVGTDLDDNLIGGVGDDTITGGAGNDTLSGGAGNDTLDGGDGDDEIYGGDGDDIIYTSAGNDIYDGGDGIDTVITDYINSPPTVGGNISLRNIENQFFIGQTNITIDRSFDPESGNNHVKSQSGDDLVLLGVGDDIFELGAGKNYSDGGAGNDTIILSSDNKFTSSYVAKNISSSLQIGTEERINLNGKTRFEDVMDGGADADTVELTDASDAFFLHDSFSGFHSSLALSDDYAGELGKARIENIETINAGGGDDIVDLTSPDYSLAGQNITVNGGEGNDTLWGSDANETINGGNGDDVLFGGAGTNTLTGGAGADEFQFTRTSIAETVTDYDLGSGDQLTFFYEAGSEEADWSFSIQNGDLRWGENTIDFGTMEVRSLDELSIFVEKIGSGQATQFEYLPTLGEEILRLDLYPALYEQDYYTKIVTDLQFAEFNDFATAIDADMTFLGGLNEVAVATGLQANGNGFTYSAGAVYNNAYNTVEISADISDFKIDGIAANSLSLQAVLEATTLAPGKVGGLFNSITLSANSTDYLTLQHSANGLSLVYDNATSGMINELRLDGSFNNDLDTVIPVVSDLLSFDFNDPIALLSSQEFLNTSADLDGLATLTGLSILQKGVGDPYLQLTATDTTLNVAYKDWDIVGAIEVSDTWQPDPNAFLTALQNLVTDSNALDLSELGSLYQGAGSLSLMIMHEDVGKLAEGIIHDFGDFVGSLDRYSGDEVIFGTAAGDSYAIDSNGLTAVVFKDREFNETEITLLLDELDIRLEGESGGSSATPVYSASGYVIKGPIQGARVFIDSNDNGVLDDDEAFTTTDASGGFNLIYEDYETFDNSNIIALGTDTSVDTSSGAVLSDFKFSAPSSSSIISPLTTLVTAGDITEQQLITALGLPDIDIYSFNPFSPEANPEHALAVEKVHQQIMSVLGSVSASNQTVDVDTFDIAIDALSEVLVSEINTGSIFDLSDQTDLESVFTAAGANADSVEVIASAVANVNQVIENVVVGEVDLLSSTETEAAFAVTAELFEQVEVASTVNTAVSVASVAGIELLTVDTAITDAEFSGDVLIIA